MQSINLSLAHFNRSEKKEVNEKKINKRTTKQQKNISQMFFVVFFFIHSTLNFVVSLPWANPTKKTPKIKTKSLRFFKYISCKNYFRRAQNVFCSTQRI